MPQREVTLTWLEGYLSAIVGVTRRIKSVKRSPGRGVNNAKDGWQIDVEGAMAEMVVAKLLLDAFWSPTCDAFHDKGADGAGPFEVKTTWRQDGSLIKRPGEPEGCPYILVVGSFPHYRIAGWMWWHEAERDEWWGTKGQRREDPAWWVPQASLRDPWEDRSWKTDPGPA